jgi:hypothetical protein
MCQFERIASRQIAGISPLPVHAIVSFTYIPIGIAQPQSIDAFMRASALS